MRPESLSVVLSLLCRAQEAKEYLGFKSKCQDFMHKDAVPGEAIFLDKVQELLDLAYTTEFEFRVGRVLSSNKKPAQQSTSILDKI